MNQSAEIVANLKEIAFATQLSKPLETFQMRDFVSGYLFDKGCFIIASESGEYAVSQWISPKRTRTYPLARVYETLHMKNRVTIIPFCKDEGADGDRDFIQWDTVSMMSLLNVHVIVGYYKTAEKSTRPHQQHKNKITHQILDYAYLGKQFAELQNYHSSALHWNLKQIEQLNIVAKHTLISHRAIANATGVKLHGEQGIEKRIEITQQGANKFKSLSRDLSRDAQNRERLTDQPKEKTIGDKATLTLTNLLGGVYYLTTDECFVLDGRVFLIEKKHSAKKPLPSQYDLKDAFIKMALFSNINQLKYNGKAMPYYATVGLTSNTVQGILHSNMTDSEMQSFFAINELKKQQIKFIKLAVAEVKSNGFGLFILNAAEADQNQEDVLRAMLVN